MFKVSFLLAFMISVSCLSANAQSQIFNETFKRCSQTRANSEFGSEVRAIWQSFSFRTVRDSFSQGLSVVTVDPKAIASVVQNKGLSARTYGLLNSPDFYRALDACYGNNASLRRAYIAGLISADVAGKVAVAGLVVAAGWLTATVISAAGVAYPAIVTTRVLTGAFIINAASVTYIASHALKEINRDATPAERAQINLLLNSHSASVEKISDETEALLRKKISSLRIKRSVTRDLNQKLAIEAKIKTLANYLDQLESAEKKS